MKDSNVCGLACVSFVDVFSCLFSTCAYRQQGELQAQHFLKEALLEQEELEPQRFLKEALEQEQQR